MLIEIKNKNLNLFYFSSFPKMGGWRSIL